MTTNEYIQARQTKTRNRKLIGAFVALMTSVSVISMTAFVILVFALMILTVGIAIMATMKQANAYYKR